MHGHLNVKHKDLIMLHVPCAEHWDDSRLFGLVAHVEMYSFVVICVIKANLMLNYLS